MKILVSFLLIVLISTTAHANHYFFGLSAGKIPSYPSVVINNPHPIYSQQYQPIEYTQIRPMCEMHCCNCVYTPTTYRQIRSEEIIERTY